MLIGKITLLDPSTCCAFRADKNATSQLANVAALSRCCLPEMPGSAGVQRIMMMSSIIWSVADMKHLRRGDMAL